MQLGMVGLGRMGANMARRLLRAGHECVGYAPGPAARAALIADGGVAVPSLADLVTRLRPPRAVWLMIPAAAVDGVLEQLAGLLSAGDVLIDGGNSFYRDDVDRAARLRERGLHYVDCGTSGGVWGLERGYCLMIGGETEVVLRLDPIFAALAPGLGDGPRTPGRAAAGAAPDTAERGYLHCGPAGAGHFVKMVHNGIEYGLMAAYAEGLDVLRRAGAGRGVPTVDAETAPLRDPRYYQYEFDLAAVAELWRRGSVIASWLLDLTAAALHRSPSLEGFAGRVSDSGEGRWTVQAAVETGVPAHVLSAALYERFESRGGAEFQNRVLSAMRYAFGGHLEERESR